MLASDTNNLYHSIIANLLISLYAEGKDPVVEAIFLDGNLFISWVAKIAQIYDSSIKEAKISRINPKCYFGYVYKILKAIYGTPGNFLQKLLDEQNNLAIEAFELFYTPKAEIDKKEYHAQSEAKSEIFDNESEKFDEILFEIDMEKSDGKFSMTGAYERGELHVEEKDAVTLIVDEEEKPQEDDKSPEGEQLYNDLHYWKTHIKYDEENMKDLLS